MCLSITHRLSASGVPLAEHTTEQFNLAMYSGLYAAFYYMKACYPYLKESKGSVINFASGAGLFGNFGQCAHAAAKEGIRGLTRVAATEWAKDGINVNIICPLAWTSQLEQFKNAYPEAFDKNVHTPPANTISVMLSLKSDVYAYSLHLQTLSI